ALANAMRRRLARNTTKTPSRGQPIRAVTSTSPQRNGPSTIAPWRRGKNVGGEDRHHVHRDLACSAGWSLGQTDRGNDRTYGRRSYGAARARASQTKEPTDARGGRRGPPEGAQAAQGAIACGDVTLRCGGSVARRRAASCRWQRTIGQAERTCRPPIIITPQSP